MRKKIHISETPAVEFLRAHAVAYSEHPYEYLEHGGASPFGTRRQMPVYIEESILALPLIFINGGKRGFLVGLDAKIAAALLHAVPVQCALPL